jgi:hypothetical protein
LLTAALALAFSVPIVLAAQWGPDWPAQQFRAWIAAHDGLSAWTNRWYGGTALPGYSVLYPPVASVLGAAGTGMLAVVATAWAAAGMAPHGRARSAWYSVAVAVALAQLLLIGQVPFLLGTLFGVLAVRSVLDQRLWALTAACAVLCSLASPLAGAFLLLAAPALATARAWPRAVPLVGAVAGSAVSVVVGGADGPFSCQWQSLAAIAVFVAITLAFGPRDNWALQVFAGCYLLAATVVFFVPNPIGGNIGRLGKLLALPLACHFVLAHGAWERVRAALVVAVAIIWPSIPFTTAVLRGADDPSQRPGFSAGLIAFLRTQDARLGRVEVPFTREHWETYWVARDFPLARGWVRQTDLQLNRVLYRPLTAAGYRAWLDHNGVALVALPRAPLDYGGRPEARLLARPPGYLRPVYHDARWQVWRVSDPSGLVSGPATVTQLGPASVSLRFSRAGTAVVRITASRLWQVSDGAGCLDRSPDGWLRVHSDRAGTVELRARLGSRLVSGAGCQA